MNRDAARMRKWMLWGAPAVLAAAWSARAGGGAAGLGVWLLLGLTLPAPRYPYPRKRPLPLSRLFFAWALGAFLLCALGTIARARFLSLALGPLPAHLLAWAGAVPLAVSLAAQTLRLPLPRAFSWIVGGILACGAGWIAMAGQ